MQEHHGQARLAFKGVAEPKQARQAETQDYVRLFSKRLLELDRSKTPFEKFRDFCEMAYCAYAKRMAVPADADALEERYMRIVGTYTDKDTVRAYPEMLAWAALAVADRQEFFGKVASQLELLDTQNSQFFTPHDVSRMMAEMIIGDPKVIIEEQGYITVQEPASGAGGMLLAVADVLENHGYDPSRHMLAQAVDISPLCYYMTYLQLTFRGIPASVIRGNTLSLETCESAWTPPTAQFYDIHGRLFSAKNPEQTSSKNPEPLLAFPALPLGQTQQLRIF